MELDKLWQWQKRKLACRVRVETGNPAGDDLRERFAELAKVDLRELLTDMKTTKKKNESSNKSFVDHESDKKYKEVLGRSHIIGASQISLVEMEKYDAAHAASLTQKNVQKRFVLLPKSPPSRVLLDIQRERAKPLRIPDQDEKNAATAKLEKKLAKQRAARMAAIEKSAMEEEKAKNAIAANDSSLSKQKLKSVLPKYDGDLFSSKGDYMESMLYLSRMADSVKKSVRPGGKVDGNDIKGDNKFLKSEARETNKIEDESSRNGIDEQSHSDHSNVTSDVGAKLYCAATLCNWARNPANAARLASEGAVRAIMQLSVEDMPRIAMFCAAAFRLMSEHHSLALSMIDEGATSTILDVVNTTTDEFIAGNLAISLVNLTRINGKEGHVVEASIVFGLMHLIMIRPELNLLCARGLYNLTCVDNAYPSIERVTRALVSLSSSGTANVKHICAAALCNLADLKQVRARIVEEGAISVLGGLARGSETRTRRVCAVILQNLSASKSCRVEMVSRSCVSVAYGLSSDQDPIILRCIGLTLSRLAIEPANCARIINESGITALCNIAVKYPTIPGISQPVAAAFQLLSSRQAVRVVIVQEGSVTAIASLLRLSVDMFTLQHSLLALCNLLSEADNHLTIVQQGLIVTLINLSGQDNDNLKDFSALAFLNLSLAEDSRKHLVNAGAIAAIINLALHKSTTTKARCAAALCNVSAFEAGMARMVGDGIIPALVRLVLADELATVRYACAALCRICSTVENANLILDSGAVPNLVQRTLSGDNVTKQFCGAVLSALSFYESCRIKLCEMDMMSAMTSLAALTDDVTKQRCLVAFANISCQESVHTMMVQQGVVGIIARLANSYQEVNYICCAKALCNLGCSPHLRLRIAEEKGVQALMMISLVHSVDKHTKLLCAIALGNLLDETSVHLMLEEGIVSSVANLSKIPDTCIENVCAKLFNQLSIHAAARDKMVEKQTPMTALFNMINSECEETRILCSRTTCNLVLLESTRKGAIDGGALQVLEKGIQLNDDETSWQGVQTLFSACDRPSFRVAITKANLQIALGRVALRSSGTKYETICKILTLLSWASDSRVFMQTPEFAKLLIQVVVGNTQMSSMRWLSSTMRYIALGHERPMELINLGIQTALRKVHDVEVTKIHDEGCEDNYNSASISIASSCAETIRSLCSTDDAAIKMATAANISLLKRVVDVCGGDSSVMYNVSVSVMRFAFSGPEGRSATITADTVAIFDAVSKVLECVELVVTSLYMALMDPKCRLIVANLTVASLVIRIIDMNPSEDALYDAVSVLYCMSKITMCREMLSASPVNADMALIRLSQGDSARLKANCARTLKNLTSDVNEAIGEGDVAALIAMSLEGKKGKVGDDISPPKIVPLKTASLRQPACGLDEVDSAKFMFFLERVVTNGGAAGKGPDAPEPPPMAVDNSTHDYPVMADEIDGGDVEGKTKMAFAKMQIPSQLLDSYLLTEADFALSESTDVGEEENAPGAVVEEGSISNDHVIADYTKSHPTQIGSNDSKETSFASGAMIDERSKHKKSPKVVRVQISSSKVEVSMGDKAAALGLYA